MPCNLQCFTTTGQNTPHRTLLPGCHTGYNGVSIPSFLIRYRGSCPLSSHDTGEPYPVFPHRIQGFLSPFLTGYKDSCPILPDWRGISVSFLAVVPVPFIHNIQGFLTPFLTGYMNSVLFLFINRIQRWLSPFLAVYRVSSPHSSQDT